MVDGLTNANIYDTLFALNIRISGALDYSPSHAAYRERNRSAFTATIRAKAHLNPQLLAYALDLRPLCIAGVPVQLIFDSQNTPFGCLKIRRGPPQNRTIQDPIYQILHIFHAMGLNLAESLRRLKSIFDAQYPDSGLLWIETTEVTRLGTPTHGPPLNAAISHLDTHVEISLLFISPEAALRFYNCYCCNRFLLRISGASEFHLSLHIALPQARTAPPALSASSPPANQELQSLRQEVVALRARLDGGAASSSPQDQTLSPHVTQTINQAITIALKQAMEKRAHSFHQLETDVADLKTSMCSALNKQGDHDAKISQLDDAAKASQELVHQLQTATKATELLVQEHQQQLHDLMSLPTLVRSMAADLQRLVATFPTPPAAPAAAAPVPPLAPAPIAPPSGTPQ
jgi:hypothetical protein